MKFSSPPGCPFHFPDRDAVDRQRVAASVFKLGKHNLV
jgi:hypothetical protein